MRRTFLLLLGATGTLAALALLFPGVAWADEAQDFSRHLGQRGYLLTYLVCFGSGIAASLTPCVYPMIPIVVGVFGARDEAVTRRRAFALATAYVLGMGLIYACLGMAFALVGKAGNQGQILSNPWIVIPLVAVYGALAASMFGAFELNLPSGLQQRLNQVGGKGYGGAFAMGMVGGFTAAPCTGPFLGGLLGWVATTRSVAVGGTMLLSFALGMGVLFWVIAATSVSLPKSGRWMEWVKSAGGIALLAVALYFLRYIVPPLRHFELRGAAPLIATIAIAIVGIAAGAVHLSFHGKALERLRKGVGVVLVVAGSYGVVAWALTADRHLPWLHDEATAFAQAKSEGKGVMVDFSAPSYCLPCTELEVKTFAKPEVYDSILASFVPLKFDVSQGTDLDDARQAKYKAETLPAVIFLDAEGRELGRIGEFVGPKKFLQVLEHARSQNHTKTASR